MARIGFVHLAVVCAGMLGMGLVAQTPAEPPAPPAPGTEMGGGDKPQPPDQARPDRKPQDGPGKKERRGEGGPMFGPGMGGPQFEKMVDLALGSDEDLQKALQKWPRIQEKEPEAQEKFLKQIENFRRFLKGQAMREAEEMGLKLTPEQEDAFVHEFWKKKLEVDRTLRKEMEPRKRELTDKMTEELKKQFAP